MLKQLKKTIAIMLAVCFLMSLTAVVVNAVSPSANRPWETSNLPYYG